MSIEKMYFYAFLYLCKTQKKRHGYYRKDSGYRKQFKSEILVTSELGCKHHCVDCARRTCGQNTAAKQCAGKRKAVFEYYQHTHRDYKQAKQAHDPKRWPCEPLCQITRCNKIACHKHCKRCIHSCNLSNRRCDDRGQIDAENEYRQT